MNLGAISTLKGARGKNAARSGDSTLQRLRENGAAIPAPKLRLKDEKIRKT